MASRVFLTVLATGFVATAILAACGGSGGGGSSTVALPAPGAPQRAITVSLALPGNGSQTHARHPQYVSPNTGSISIGLASVNTVAPVPLPTPTVFAVAAPACTTATPIICTFTLNVPVAKSVVLAITAYASANGTGAPLSLGVTLPVDTTQANPVFHASLGGIPATVAYFVGSSTTPATTTSLSVSVPQQLNILALDASNAVIIGSTPYSAPITLTVTGDPNHDLTLSASSLSAPATTSGANPISLTYAPASLGTQLTSVTLTASIGGNPLGSMTITPLNLTSSTTPLTTLFSGGAAATFTVQEAGYAGAFTLVGPGSFATTTCAPTTCAPATAGGSVAITVTPASAQVGNATLTISDSTGTFLGVNVIVTGTTNGGVTVPTSAPIIREYPIPTPGSNPADLTVGPNGSNIWFTESVGSYVASYVAKIFVSTCTTATCAMRAEPLPTPASGSIVPSSIAVGNDGNLWIGNFSASSSTRLVQVVVNTSSCALITSPSLNCPFTMPNVSIGSVLPQLTDVATGPDGNLYFTEYDGGSGYPSYVGALLAPLAAATPAVNEVTPTTAPFAPQPQRLTIGPDRNMWFTDSAAGGGIGRVSCTNVSCNALGEFNGFGSNGTYGIVSGPDGYLYVSEQGSNAIARVLPTACFGLSCTIQQSIVTSGAVYGLAVGSDGNVWYADPAGTLGKIGVIELATCSTTCIIHEYPIPSSHTAQNLIRGPDGNIWFTEPTSNAIGEVVLH